MFGNGSVVWQLGPGERLVLYTDGLVEARNSMEEPFGRHRLQAELAASFFFAFFASLRATKSRAKAQRTQSKAKLESLT
jgi:serine phosphatase RsbU (regulator of sigma subunit)